MMVQGLGRLFSNAAGEVMATLSARGDAVADSEEAEVRACRKALEFAIDAGFSELIVEGDYVARTRTRTRTRYGHGHEDTAIFEK